MSYFGGGGWVPPVPPPFYNQPPPGMPIPFYTNDPSAYPHGVQPEYHQQGYQYIPAQAPAPVPDLRQEQPPQPVPAAVPPPVSVPPRNERNFEREQRRPGYASPSQYSPPARGSERPDRRTSPDRGRSYRNEGDDDRYSRQTRSPTGDYRHRRQGSDVSEERGHLRERDGRERNRNSKEVALPPSDKPKVDIDALLQDERLRNVLFAGISKATAKLEQSLQDKDQPDFESKEAKSQLFPSASSSQKPRSILKRKDGAETSDSKTLSNLSALEKTLQMLRGKKGDIATTHALSSKSSSDHNPPNQGALSQLAVYDEGNDEESYHHEKPQTEKKKSMIGNHPFWSMPSELETSKRESDSFDAKEKMFEEWRQSIGKQPDSKPSEREMFREAESAVDNTFRKRNLPKMSEGDNQEELDSTVQNILQSIGFNFDLSKRMQELARKKKRQEDEGNSGIQNTSASFMDRGDILAEELKASLLQSGSDISKIENLIREVRATSQGSRHSSRSRRMRSPSPDNRSSSYGRDVRGISPISREEYVEREEQRRSRDQTRGQHKSNDQWERVSPDRYSSSQRFSPPRRSNKERDSLSPPGDRGHRRISERFRDDVERNDYYYPEKEFVDTPPSVPLLTSFSSRKKNEDLSGGLLKPMRVENFRVMSRPTHETEDDLETRRIILPAKSEHRNFSPRDRDMSPIRTVTRKRSASPLSMPLSKERRMSPTYGTKDFAVYSRRSPDDHHSGRRSPDDRRPGRRSPVDHYTKPTSSSTRRLNSKDQSPSIRRPNSDLGDLNLTPVERKRSPLRLRSPSPPRRSPSPPRRRSREHRSRSPYKRRSRSRNRSRSPYRQRSPPRRRRSPSPQRGRSKSPIRKRRSPARRSPPSHGRKRSPVKKGERPKPREKNKQESFKSDEKTEPRSEKTKTKPKDLSKSEEQERKKGKTEVVKEPEPGKTASSEKIVDALDGLTKMTSDVRAQVTIKALLLNADEQSKTLKNVTSRKAKISTLKQDLERLKKAQNELMRKSQRSGLGNKDPQLNANNLAQLEIEKEMDRLSAPDLEVEVQSDLEEKLSAIRLKAQRLTKSLESTSKAKPSKAESKPTKTLDGSTTTPNKGESAGQTSWTSVAVKEEALPEIKDSKEKDSKSDDKKGNRKERRSSVPGKPKRDIYYEYVDSGNHWCRHCHVSCNALDQFLSHCHGKKHLNVIGTITKPWQSLIDEQDKNKRKVGQAQTRRIKGSEMLFPVNGFYCSLCKVFCGDLAETEAHLKSDKHYDTYLDYLRDNPSYEKKLLLEKSMGKKQNESAPALPPLPPPPSFPPSVPGGIKKKKKKKAKSFRQKMEEEEREAGNVDNTVSVDMDLDDDDERDDDVDVKSKVPKMSVKTSSLAAILSGLPDSGESNSSIDVKSEKEDEVTSLGKFLTIAKDKSKSKKHSKLPVVTTTKSELDLSSIPIPVPVITTKNSGLDLSSIPIPDPIVQGVEQKLSAIPLPDSTLCTVKSLQQIQEEEKRMMGIDVDAEEEKPLAPIKPPPPLSETLAQNDIMVEKTENVKEDVANPKRKTENVKEDVANPKRKTENVKEDVANPKRKTEHVKEDVANPKRKDSEANILDKFLKRKLKQTKLTTTLESASEMELRFQREIEEKLENEKQKLIREQEKKEIRERKREEKNLQKKKVLSDSSSEEETESEEEEVTETPEVAIENIGVKDVASMPSKTSTILNQVVPEENEDNQNSVTILTDLNVVQHEMTEEVEVASVHEKTSEEVNTALLVEEDVETKIETVVKFPDDESTIINIAESTDQDIVSSSMDVDAQNIISEGHEISLVKGEAEISQSDALPSSTQAEQGAQNESQNIVNLSSEINMDTNEVSEETVTSVSENVVEGNIRVKESSEVLPDLISQKKMVAIKVLQVESDLLSCHGGEGISATAPSIKLITQTEQEPQTESHNIIDQTADKISDADIMSENKDTSISEQITVESIRAEAENLQIYSDPFNQEDTSMVTAPKSTEKKGEKMPVTKTVTVNVLQTESDLFDTLAASQEMNESNVKPSVELDTHAEQRESQNFTNISAENNDTDVASENKNISVSEKIAEESSVKDGEILQPSSDPIKQQGTPKAAVPKTSAKKKGKKPPLRKTLAVKALQSESDLLGVLSISPDKFIKSGQKKTPVAKKQAPKTKRGGKTQATQKIALEALSDEPEDFSMDDFVVLSEVTEEDEEAGQTREDEALLQKAEADANSIKSIGNECENNDNVQSANVEEKSDETVKSRPMRSGERNDPSPQIEESADENRSTKQGVSSETNENDDFEFSSGLVVLSEVKESDGIDNVENVNLLGERNVDAVVELHKDIDEQKEGDMIQPTVSVQRKGMKSGGRGKGRKVTKKRENTSEVSGQSEQKNDISSIDKGNESQSLKETDDASDLLAKNDISSIDTEKESQSMKETDDASALLAKNDISSIDTEKESQSLKETDGASALLAKNDISSIDTEKESQSLKETDGASALLAKNDISSIDTEKEIQSMKETDDASALLAKNDISSIDTEKESQSLKETDGASALLAKNDISSIDTEKESQSLKETDGASALLAKNDISSIDTEKESQSLKETDDASALLAKNDFSAIDKEKESQSLKETDDASTLPADSVTAAAEDEAEIPAMTRTRRSGRVAAAKTSPTKATTGRQTRSRGKKNTPDVESQENKNVIDESASAEIPHVEPEPSVRTLRSREPKVAIIDIDESLNTEMLSLKDEQKNANEEMPTLEPEAAQEEVDSDATVTEDVSDLDSFDVSTEVTSGNVGSIFTSTTTAAASQPKDPPMSGVISETESSENMVMPMEEDDELQMATDVSEFGSLPTAGLSLGLEDDSNSIDFTMVEEGN